MIKISKRHISIIGASIIFFSILGTLFIYNWNQYQTNRDQFKNCNDSWCVRISGNVNYEMSVGISYLLNDSFARVENQEFQVLNSFETNYNKTLSGVVLWDILNQTGLLRGNSSLIQFQASDGYKSFKLPLRIIQNFPKMIIIVTHIDGKLIPPKENGGDGPLMAAVDYPSLINDSEVEQIFNDNQQDFVYNSQYNVKYLNSIIII
ncbi:hypothetical protein [Candidatus Lokiarchaeum ossiferum]|uniref:hypothetical protein n=1 Tax=Candidatus Lokiarchaeum ossiferum TaxID=2951803 RepID=UPI00352EB995